ncbi:hypothetical protein [Muricoccus aerilatus]|uniref:hypothetical protein n=1 Tax=Muricoccus aerilatus TaxID=452982 RepID=UPI0012EB2E50|nr:hypothetical protein [Roseomonas aerilata]
MTDTQRSSPEAAAAWLLQRLAAMEAMQLTVNSGVDLMEWSDLGPAAVQAVEPLQPEPEPSLPSEALVVCDREMLREGFYDAETGANGRSFRWIGPEPRAAVFLPRVAQPAEIRLLVHSAFCPEVLGDVRVALDGGARATVTLEQGPEGRVLVAQPPPAEVPRGGAMRLDIDVVRTDSPLNRGQSDPRMLGIALRRIEARSV